MFIYASARGSSPFVPMFVFLAWSFIQGDLDGLNGEEASRVSVARGHRSSQAYCLSAPKGLDVPLLLDRMKSTDRNERNIWFFRHWGGTPC